MLRKRLAACLALTMIMANCMTIRADEIDVPQDIVAASEELGAQYNICPETIQAICWKESSFDPLAYNDGCIGVMQVSPKWHKDRMDKLGVTDLYDLRQNMTVGVDYLSELIEEYEDVGISLMMYNGDSSAKDVISGTGYMSDYYEEILEISEELERRNGK